MAKTKTVYLVLGGGGMTIEIEGTLPNNLSVEEFIDFLSVQSCDIEANILNSAILSVENN